MYEVKIFNGPQSTVIHTPNSSIDAPHLLSLILKESLSRAELLAFSIPYNNSGFNSITALKTKVKVIDTTDDKIIFSGRVLIPKDSISSDGKFIKQVSCEAAMNYLNDSQTRRWNFTNKTPTEILTFLLNQHNSKVDTERQIQLGVVEITQPITIDTNYETTLNTIITKLHNILGGDLRVRESNNILYLDYLTDQGANNEVEIRLRHNLKEIIREYDPMEVITRGIVLGYGEGINQLDITSVNGGIEYVEDSEAIATYGVIEGVITNKDIQNADTLKIYGENVLKEKKQPRLTYEIGALDLSVLTGHENEKYELGDTLHTIVDVMNVDVYSRVIERERDLINNPWDPRLTISTRPITLTDQMIDLKQRSLTLENAPQGNTCIFPIAKAENADSTHPIEFDLDIPQEAININRVYINLHGRKYRAYESSVTGGSSSKSTSGASSKTSSGSGGYQSGSSLDNETIEPTWANTTISTQNAYPEDFWADGKTHQHNINKSNLSHTHLFGVSLPNHTHNIDHTHDIDHTHSNSLIYNIYESTYPKNVKIKVNGVDIGVNFGDGTTLFDEYNIDITARVNIGNNKIEITTEQNGRIDAVVYTQIFIQSK